MQTDPFAKYDPEILKTVRNMRLLDDDLMTKVFESTECVELVLRLIMDVPTLKVVPTSRTQDSLKNLQGKSVRFDVWAEDASGAQYNIEVQRADKGAGCKRARYNSAILDSNIADPGDEYQKLPQTYVIFITERDVLKKGQLCYRIKRMYWDESYSRYEEFKDEAHIIYVNATHHDISTELGKLMADFRAKDPEQMYFEPLKERVKYFKQEPEGVGSMCRAVEELQEKALNKGMDIGEEKGWLKGLCWAVYNRQTPLKDAIKASEKEESEFMEWMHKFYPDYKA